MSSSYILVSAAGEIVNRIELEDDSTWSPPDGLTVILDTVGMEIGGTHLNGVYSAPIRALPKATDFTLTKRQICAALILSGLTTDPDAWMRGLMSHIPNATQRALALNDWLYAPVYVRTNPLFSDQELIGPAGLNAAAIDGLWLMAKDLPA